jgi:sulfur carrier protein ThiS
VCTSNTDRDMATIIFNAFSFLQKKLNMKNLPCTNVAVEVVDGTTARDFVASLGLGQEEVEAVFVNGSVVRRDQALKDGDRIGLVPPGTPGPYRVMLSMVQRRHDT